MDCTNYVAKDNNEHNITVITNIFVSYKQVKQDKN